MFRQELKNEIVEKLIKLTEKDKISWSSGDSNILFQSKFNEWIIEIRNKRGGFCIEGRTDSFVKFFIGRQNMKNKMLVENIQSKKRVNESELKNNLEFLEKFKKTLDIE